jgi:hypothetical protein
MVLIHAIETAKPRREREERHGGAWFGVVVKRMIARTHREATRPYSVWRIRARLSSGHRLAQRIRTRKNGAVKICTMTSQRFHSLGSKGVEMVAGSWSGDWAMLSEFVIKTPGV